MLIKTLCNKCDRDITKREIEEDGDVAVQSVSMRDRSVEIYAVPPDVAESWEDRRAWMQEHGWVAWYDHIGECECGSLPPSYIYHS